MRRVRWTEAAQDELLRIVEFISRDNPEAAQRVKDRIETVANTMIAEHLGRAGRVVGTYEVFVPRTRYIIAYRLTPPSVRQEAAEILHLIHTSRDWKPGDWPE